MPQVGPGSLARPCSQDGDLRYCTQGCQSEDDCPVDFTCMSADGELVCIQESTPDARDCACGGGQPAALLLGVFGLGSAGRRRAAAAQKP